MVTAFTTALPPAALPAGGTILVSIGTPLLIALLVAALVAIGAVFVQGAVSAPAKRGPALRVVPQAADAVAARDAA